ncbi:hypothetical protein Trydic_g2683 [Trypoxylus dichotomus]
MDVVIELNFPIYHTLHPSKASFLANRIIIGKNPRLNGTSVNDATLNGAGPIHPGIALFDQTIEFISEVPTSRALPFYLLFKGQLDCVSCRAR